MTTDSAVLLNWDAVAMPPKRQPSVTDLTVEELRRLIREEVQTSMRDQLSDLSSRLDNIEHQMKSLNEFKATISYYSRQVTPDWHEGTNWPQLIGKHILTLQWTMAIWHILFDTNRIIIVSLFQKLFLYVCAIIWFTGGNYHEHIPFSQKNCLRSIILFPWNSTALTVFITLFHFWYFFFWKWFLFLVQYLRLIPFLLYFS